MNQERPAPPCDGESRTIPASSTKTCCDEARNLATRIEELLAQAAAGGPAADRYDVRLAQR